MFIYSIDPIDFWPGWYTEADYLKAVADADEIVGNALPTTTKF